MKVNYLHSITEIKSEHCYQTKGSKPIRVLCDDLNFYVYKYHIGSGFPFSLFNEYLAACFLQIWQLPVPDFAFVAIDKSHVELTTYPYHYFENICFGSKFMGSYKEVDKIFLETTLLKKENISARDSFLKTALFDIWLCNEDRHFENFNLLYDLKSDVFVPIDHVCCFNSSNLDKAACLISSNESILASPFFNRFFDRNLQTKFNEIRLSIIEEFKTNVKLCHENLESILAQTPVNWTPDPSFLKTRLKYFFSEEWIKQCLDHFTQLFYLNLKRP